MKGVHRVIALNNMLQDSTQTPPSADCRSVAGWDNERISAGKCYLVLALVSNIRANIEQLQEEYLVWNVIDGFSTLWVNTGPCQGQKQDGSCYETASLRRHVLQLSTNRQKGKKVIPAHKFC